MNEKLLLLIQDELKTAKKSNKEFKTELTFVKETSELFLKTFEIIGNLNVQAFSYSEDACFRISYRIFRICRCTLKLSLEGYYDVSLALLRIAYENHLLMNYLSKNEKEAKLWFFGKIFKASFLRKNVSYSSDSLYREMSEFIHSSFKSTLAFTEREMDGLKAILGEYNEERNRSTLRLLLMTLSTTAILLSLIYGKELTKNEEWNSLFKETIPKIWKSLP